MSDKITNKQIFSSLIWKMMERGGVQGVSFLVSIILARLLSTEEYGIIALVTVFITLANVFVQTGFNTALIHKKQVDETDFSTIFYASLLIATVLYIVLFLTAPLIARFYNQPELEPVIKVLSVILFLGAVNSVQIAYVSRNMMFKKLFYSSLGAVIASSIMGVALAYLGYGVWALVGQQITSYFFTTLIMWFSVKWRPKLLFSFKKLKGLLSYGWKILMAALIDALYLDLRSLIIGKIFSSQILGYHNRGKQFPTVIVNNIDGSIQSVMLPTYSAHQNDRKRVKSIMKRSISTSSFIVFPLMTGLAIVAESLVKLVLTDKWLPCVPFMQIYCIVYAIRPLLTANVQAIKGLGYSGTFLKIEIANKILGIVVLAVSIPFGVLSITWGVLITNMLSAFLYSYPNTKLLGYKFSEMLKDITPAFMLSLIMAILINFINYVHIPTIWIMFLQVVAGGIIYIALAWLLKIEVFFYLLNILKGFRKKSDSVRK